MANDTSAPPFLRLSDLQDPTEYRLNNIIQQLFTLATATSTTSTWTAFAPPFGGSLTLNTFATNECQYQHVNSMVFLNIDITFTIASGSSPSFTIAYPTSYVPASPNGYGDVLGCILTIGGAIVPALANVTGGAILVQSTSGSNLATGSARVQISGFYRTAS